ncbi:hypothetical protein AB0H37_24730 [Actinomadura sp. NPDC023710]|uniref:hypothetical protein n=1 Tax=Actinomadura sp. NPDC023710 TaxID=3158219 RepID=UPI0033F991BA
MMLAAVPDKARAQAEAIMAEFLRVREIDKTGVTIYQEQRAELEKSRAANRELGRIVEHLGDLIKNAFSNGAEDPIEALHTLGNYLAETLVLDGVEYDRAYQALEDRRRDDAALKAALAEERLQLEQVRAALKPKETPPASGAAACELAECEQFREWMSGGKANADKRARQAETDRDELLAELEEERRTVDALRQNRDQLQDELTAARKGKIEQMLGRLDDWDGDLAAVVSDRSRLNAQRDAVLMLIGEAHSLAAADIQAGGPRNQLDDLAIPVHDLLIAFGVLGQDGTGRVEQKPGDQERRNLVAATIATALARRMVICEHTQVIEYGSCADAVLTALARWDDEGLRRAGRLDGTEAERA